MLVLTSSSAALGIELRSAYLEGERTGSVLVAESRLIGGDPAELRSRMLPLGDGALTTDRRLLLLDHLSSLQNLAYRAGHPLGFDGLDAAACDLDPHFWIGS